MRLKTMSRWRQYALLVVLNVCLQLIGCGDNQVAPTPPHNVNTMTAAIYGVDESNVWVVYRTRTGLAVPSTCLRALVVSSQLDGGVLQANLLTFAVAGMSINSQSMLAVPQGMGEGRWNTTKMAVGCP